MESIYLLIPIALLFVILALKLFFWAVDSDQYSDLDKEGSSILFEDEEEQQKPKESTKRQEHP